MITNQFEFADTLWTSLLRRLSYSTLRAAPRGKGIRELLGVNLTLTDVRNNIILHPARNINLRFMVAEWLWMWFGRDDVATIDQYNSVLKQFSDDGITFNGAYGVPIKAQWPALVELLKTDPDTRQAVLSIFKPQTRPSKDVPCTISLQFLQRDRSLTTIATMRSSDVWLGLPYDIFNFTMFAQCMAAELGIQATELVLNLGSSHLYDVNAEQAAEVLKTNSDFLRSPRLRETPPQWLDGVLRDPRLAMVTTYTEIPPEPWLSYAHVLMSPRDAALARLKVIEVA